MKATKFFLPTLFLLIIGVLNSCNKETGRAALKIHMTDAPGDYEEVNVEIRRVEIHYSGLGWIQVKTIQGVYDLLTLQNGISTVIVDDNDVPAGEITQIRLILGNQNSIKVLGNMHQLTVPSGYQTGIKINAKRKFTPGGLTNILIDFDAELSVVYTEGSGYILKPVIKVIE
ncbi:MAG: DUF4382 domain-containing protein [Flavobacteriales bacterium]